MDVRTAAGYLIAELMGPDATNEDGESFRAYLLERGVTDTDAISDEQFVGLTNEWAARD